MAIYYFDRNGTTSGFGTLSGTWDTTTASWTTDVTGVTAPSAITFTNADTAQFGRTGTSAVASTATIAAGLTVTLNKITSQNLSTGIQIIAGANATTSILTFSGTTPTLDIQNTNGMTISARISGSENITKTGNGDVILSGGLSDYTGTITLNSSSIISFHNPSFGAMTISQSSGSRSGGSYMNIRPTVTNGYSFPAGFNLTGAGIALFLSTNVTTLTTGFTLPAGATAGLTGTSAGSAATSATTGLVSVTETSVAANRTNTLNLNDLPSVFTFEFITSTNAVTQTHNLYYISTGLTHNYSTRIDVINYSGTNAAPGSHLMNLYANQSSGPLVLSGGIIRYSVGVAVIGTYSATLNLRGTNDQDNEISGNITQTSGVLLITKNDAGRWILSGTNTYSGLTTLTAGFLNLRNSSALGSSTSGNVTLTSGTLEIQGNISLNKSTPSASLNGSIIKNVSGSNSFITGSSALGAATTFNIETGSLTFPGVITGSNTAYSITKTGNGTMRLSSTSSSYVGPTVVSQGILEFVSINDAGSASNSSLGKPALALAQSGITLGATNSAGLSHVGSTAVSTNRSLTFSGGSGTTLTIDSSGAGSGAITYSSGGTLSFTGAGEHTINFEGTNSNSNTFARTIADGPSGSTYIQKFGSNTWVLSTITATGTAACYGGILNFGSVNVTTISTLYSSGGTIAITNGNTIAANTVMTGEGTITAVLTGNKTLLVDSSSTEAFKSTLQPDDTNGNNSFTGAVTVSGCVDLIIPNAVTPSTSGTARVLGTTNTVTIGSGGIIRTKYSPSSNQNGSARYHNLVLQNNSKMKIGFAA